MLWNQNIVGVTKSDVLALIAIVKHVNTINSNNELSDDDKHKRIFNVLEDYSSVVDDCDVINNRLINDTDYTIIKLIEEL